MTAAASLVTAPPPVVTTCRTAWTVKIAVALRSAVMTSVQVAAVPVQAPLQPVKLEPGAATAVSVTVVPLTRLSEQVAPQAMTDAASLVTVPLPVPAATTWSAAWTVKIAVALRSAVMTSVQVAAVPVQAPLQPVKLEPGAATAVSVTVVPFVTLVVHVAPQAMPAGLLVTVPVPVPEVATVTVALAVNLAIAVRSVVIESVQVSALPEQAPLQPVKVESDAGTAVSVTLVPLATAATQVAPQSMPVVPFPVTVPLPVPAVATVRIGLTVNVAVAVRPVVIVSVQVTAVPEQAPLQPANVESAAATAVSVTLVPFA
jgi:hypothetical protein